MSDQRNFFQCRDQFPTLFDQQGDLFPAESFPFEFLQNKPFGNDVHRIGIFDAFHRGHDFGSGECEPDPDAGHAPGFRQGLQYDQVRKFRQTGQEPFVFREVDIGFVEHDDTVEPADDFFHFGGVEQVGGGVVGRTKER